MRPPALSPVSAAAQIGAFSDIVRRVLVGCEDVGQAGHSSVAIVIAPRNRCGTLVTTLDHLKLAYVADVIAHHHPPPRSDSRSRRRRQARNSLCSAWLRRPLGSALGHTLSMARLALSDRAMAEGMADAAGGMRWVLHERRAVGWQLEKSIRLLGDSI